MRLFLLFSLAVSLILYFLFSGSAVYWNLPNWQEDFYRYAYNRNIKISGNSVLSGTDISDLLPQQSSNFWWYLNQSQIQRQLAVVPLVKNVVFKNCAYSISCYEIEIKERSPSMISLVNRQAWLLDSEGVFLLAIPKNRDPFQEALRLKLPIISLADEALSELKPSEILQALNLKLPAFKEHLGKLQAYSIDVTKDGELKIKFVGLSMIATFSGFNGDLAKLPLEVERFAEVLSKLDSRLEMIESVDIAYDKLAVVKLKAS